MIKDRIENPHLRVSICSFLCCTNLCHAWTLPVQLRKFCGSQRHLFSITVYPLAVSWDFSSIVASSRTAPVRVNFREVGQGSLGRGHQKTTEQPPFLQELMGKVKKMGSVPTRMMRLGTWKLLVHHTCISPSRMLHHDLLILSALDKVILTYDVSCIHFFLNCTFLKMSRVCSSQFQPQQDQVRFKECRL